MSSFSNRRDFLKAATVGAAALSVHGGQGMSDDTQLQETRPEGVRRDKLRVGFVGVGAKGSCHLGSLLRMPEVEVVAVCDIVERQCVEAQRQAERLGLRVPAAYFNGERDFERLCAEEELDLVYTATPWEWHTPVCLAAMQNGKHAATEIPAAVTLDECWQLVETSERTGKRCVMMENVNYQQNEMAIWRMIREGVLGELVYAEAGYMHDTRYLQQYEHPLWAELREKSLGQFADVPPGQITKGSVWEYDPVREVRGGDFLEDYRLIQALWRGEEPDYNVYDAATWSVIAPLSEQSVATRSCAVDIPDFTRGRWKTTPPLRIKGV